jgi:H+/Cl- antiporter ClcA
MAARVRVSVGRTDEEVNVAGGAAGEGTGAKAGAAAGEAAGGAAASGPPGAAEAPGSRLLYLHVIVVALGGGFALLGWFALYEWLNKKLWDNSFVSSHHWMFPVICLPLSLVVGLLVKYFKAPNNLEGSLLDSLTGDVSHLQWKNLPVTVVQSLVSLFSGAVLGPEGAIGSISSKIAAFYCDAFRIPVADRPKLVFTSVSSAYNGLLESPVFTAVLGTEVSPDKTAWLATLPATLIGGAIGYGVFLLVGNSGFANFLHLPPVKHYVALDMIYVVLLAFVGIVLAVLTGLFMQVALRLFGRFQKRIVTRALIAGVIFSVAGYFAPLIMFSGESQSKTLIANAASYGVALLLVIAVVKLALLAVGFKSGFLGGPTFPLIFASTSVALALNIVFPDIPITILVAGIMASAVYVLFRTPLMVVLLTAFMLNATPDLTALIILSVATAMIVTPQLQRLIAARQAERRAGRQTSPQVSGGS